MDQGGDALSRTGNGGQNAILMALSLLAVTMAATGLKIARRKA